MYQIILCMLPVLVDGFANGAPSEACDGMTPNHQASPQVGASSYSITPSATTYDCGETITVTLSGANFKGFLCQARPSVDTYTTVGTLTDTDESVETTNNCAGEAALTHTEQSVKSSFQFSWTQSGTSTDTVYIVCTIVQERTTFWVKESSVAISYGGAAAECS